MGKTHSCNSCTLNQQESSSGNLSQSTNLQEVKAKPGKVAPPTSQVPQTLFSALNFTLVSENIKMLNEQLTLSLTVGPLNPLKDLEQPEVLCNIFMHDYDKP